MNDIHLGISWAQDFPGNITKRLTVKSFDGSLDISTDCSYALSATLGKSTSKDLSITIRCE